MESKTEGMLFEIEFDPANNQQNIKIKGTGAAIISGIATVICEHPEVGGLLEDALEFSKFLLIEYKSTQS